MSENLVGVTVSPDRVEVGGRLNSADGGSRTLAIMGDPALRLHVTAPVSNLAATNTGTVALSWSPSLETNALYFVYRSTNSLDGPFVKLTSNPISTTGFVDALIADTATARTISRTFPCLRRGHLAATESLEPVMGFVREWFAQNRYTPASNGQRKFKLTPDADLVTVSTGRSAGGDR